jgi:hypothetical protein
MKRPAKKKAARKAAKTQTEEFNLLTWSSTIPLCDDLWLGMQARNIAIVDMTMLRRIEGSALAEYARTDRTPTMILMTLSALSQMWIFSLYEFLRTWRERAKHIIKIADEYQTVLPRKKAAFLEKSVATAQGKEKHVRIAITFASLHVSKIEDPKFVKVVRDYFDATEGLFREIEGLRVTLAKHEIPDTRGFFAEAPGYARMSYWTGSLYWHYQDKHDGTIRVDRRVIANAFFGITDDYTGPTEADG